MTHLGAVVLQDLPHRGDHHLAQVARDPFLPRQGTHQDAAVAPRPPASSPHPTLVAFCRKETLPTSPRRLPCPALGPEKAGFVHQTPPFWGRATLPPQIAFTPRSRSQTASRHSSSTPHLAAVPTSRHHSSGRSPHSGRGLAPAGGGDKKRGHQHPWGHQHPLEGHHPDPTPAPHPAPSLPTGEDRCCSPLPP